MTPSEFYGTNATTSNESDLGTLNFKTLEDAILELRSLPKRDQWLLVDPNGTVFKGDIKAILRVIMQNHPISQPNFHGKIINRKIVP